MTVVTQVVVDKDDPAFQHPTKPIGPFYSKEEGKKIEQERGWKVVEDSGRGYRIVVPSPMPLRTVETNIIQMLLDDDVVVIAAGGGGIPVVIEPNNTYKEVDAVVDKDLASSVLAREIQADLLVILTGVAKVAINFNTPEEKTFGELHIDEAMAYFHQGHFPAGSMGPKIKAAVDFLESDGREVIITSIQKVGEALEGNNGTRIVK
jgi:carbamate kinase